MSDCQGDRTALNYALEKGHIEHALLLCQEDSVDPNIPASSTGFYPLHNADARN